MNSRRPGLPLLGVLSIAFAMPAMAQAQPAPEAQTADTRPQWPGATGVPAPGYDQAAWEQARADWLAECRANRGSDRTVGGAVLGGLVGGLIGNRVAGRGNRTAGTVVGAVGGAAVGGAIGSAADRRAARDYCEAYLERYTGHPGAGAYGHGQPLALGYAPMMVMMPVAMVQAAAPPAPRRECTETVVTEEWVPIPDRPHHRHIPPRRVPDKRVRMN